MSEQDAQHVAQVREDLETIDSLPMPTEDDATMFAEVRSDLEAIEQHSIDYGQIEEIREFAAELNEIQPALEEMLDLRRKLGWVSLDEVIEMRDALRETVALQAEVSR